MNRLTILFSILISTLSFSCAEEETLPTLVPGLYDGGFFVSNEGNFGDADGSLSYISEDGMVQNNLFFSVNNEKLGDVVQSLQRSENHLFAIVNNSNKVEAMSLDSLKSSYTISDVALPRYMISDETKGYLTEWVSFSDSGQVSMFDLSTGMISKSIKTGFGAEGVLLVENYLFVTNSFSTEVVVIDLTTEKIVKTIEVGSNPKLMALDTEGDLWIGCGGGSDQDWQPLNNGALVEIDVQTLSVKSKKDLETNFSAKIAANAGGEKFFYTVGNVIYSFDTISKDIEALITQDEINSFYGIGVNADGDIYASDAKAFEGNGTVYSYTSNGILKSTYTVGRGPNGFAFN